MRGHLIGVIGIDELPIRSTRMRIEGPERAYFAAIVRKVLRDQALLWQRVERIAECAVRKNR